MAALCPKRRDGGDSPVGDRVWRRRARQVRRWVAAGRRSLHGAIIRLNADGEIGKNIQKTFAYGIRNSFGMDDDVNVRAPRRGFWRLRRASRLPPVCGDAAPAGAAGAILAAGIRCERKILGPRGCRSARAPFV